MIISDLFNVIVVKPMATQLLHLTVKTQELSAPVYIAVVTLFLRIAGSRKTRVSTSVQTVVVLTMPDTKIIHAIHPLV